VQSPLADTQLWQGRPPLSRPKSPSRNTDIAAGREATCAVLASGQLLCWGRYPAWTEARRSPTPLEGLGQVSQIVAGFGTTCAVRTDGGVWCWGNNELGAVGQNQPYPALRPVEVTLPK